MVSNRVLHVLSQEGASTPTDVPRITADCGHICVASPRTHAMLADTSLVHVIRCVDCFAQET